MGRAGPILLRSRWTLAGVPLVIAVLAIATGALLDREVAQRAERDEAERAQAVRDTLVRRVEAYTEVLYGVRGLFDATGRPSRAEFHRYITGQRVGRRFPGVAVVGFAERVDREDLPAFRARVGADARASGLGYPRFVPQPDRGQSELVLISYLEPQQGNEQAFGLDFLSEEARRDAVEGTRSTGMPVATAPVRLVQDTGRPRPGFLIHLATPGGGASFEGTAYAAFRVGDLVRLALPDAVREGDLEIRDGSALLFDADPRTDAREGDERGLDLLGRRGRVASLLREDTVATRAVGWIVALIGLALAVVAALLLRSLTTTEARARALAAQMTRDLADSNAELERFAYVASHDLQEPLRSVSGFVGLLGRQYGDRLDDRGRGYLGHIERGAARMRALVADLLEYSRLQRVTTQPCDLDVAWAQAVSSLEGSITESGATVSADPLPTVSADPARMVQVFQNLVANAIKYGGRHVHASASRAGDTWEVVVRDDGPGIHPRYHDKVFELFERLDARTGVEGTGMGLSICKRAIERFGGHMWVESAPGQGAAFHFRLPAA